MLDLESHGGLFLGNNTWSNRVVFFLSSRSSSVIVIFLIVSILLVYPLIDLAPTQQASPNPPGEVYDMQADIDAKFPTPVHFATYVLEARDGDVLTRDVLVEFKENRDRLLAFDKKGELSAGTLINQPYLFSYFDTDIGLSVTGISSILDPIDLTLREMGAKLATASDTEIKLAVAELMSNTSTRGMLDLLSTKAISEDRIINGEVVKWWTSPAMLFHFLADNEKLGGAGLEIGLGGGTDVVNKEHLNRKIRSVMTGYSRTYHVWGVAIDANLESEEEGQAAGLFITFTVIGALLVIGLSLKSYWITVISGIGLGILMIWLKGISALIGLKSGLVIDLLVPIGMISLGVDFVVHAMHRYREEILVGHLPRMALRVGLSGVIGALLLAMASDSVAFLSNLSSNIEAVVHFGSAAAIAVLSSFIILGIVAPIISMRVDELINLSGERFTGKFMAALKICGGMGAACASAGSVILMLAVSKIYGVVMLGATALLFAEIPIAYLYILVGRNSTGVERSPYQEKHRSDSASRVTSAIERVVVTAASNSSIVLTGAVLFTLLSGFFAFRLEPTFDVRDFFDSESDFVTGLDKLSEHLGEKGGEPGVAYIRGDLMDPGAVLAISQFIERLREVENVAETPSGEVTIGLNVVNTSRIILGSPEAIKSIERETGVVVQDSNKDGIPDSRDQMQAAYKYALSFGVPGKGGDLILRPDQVRGAIYYPYPTSETTSVDNLTTVQFQLPGTRNQSAVTAAGKALRPLLYKLELQPSIAKAALTGSPFTREEQLAASTRTLYRSLPIAFVAATILLLFAMQSFRYAIVTVIPILLVVAWLYGIMFLAGFALNFVTAMIGAISIGVGIDYSIHMTQRFREELGRNINRLDAMRKAARGTGVALVASAASSVVGFAIMGFAPMPMFASYGQLTALMIFFALLASLVVLPCLLMVVTKESELIESSSVDFEKSVN